MKLKNKNNYFTYLYDNKNFILHQAIKIVSKINGDEAVLNNGIYNDSSSVGRHYCLNIRKGNHKFALDVPLGAGKFRVDVSSDKRYGIHFTSINKCIDFINNYS